MNHVAVTDVNQRLRNAIANAVDEAADSEDNVAIGPYLLSSDTRFPIIYVRNSSEDIIREGSKQAIIDWLERDLIKATASTGNVVDGPIVASNAIGGRPCGLVGENILPSAPIDEVSV